MRCAPLLVLLLSTSLTACVADDSGVDPDPDAGVVDRAPPETTLLAAPEPLTAQPAVRFEFSSDDPDATFACSVDDRAPTECSSPLELSPGDGVHALEIAAIDPSGNVDRTAVRYLWRIDTRAPLTRLTDGPAALDNSVNAHFELACDEPACTFECALDGAPFAACLASYSTPALADGPHQLAVRALDEIGNVDPAPLTHGWSLDTSTPDTVIESAPSGTLTTRAATFTFGSADAAAGSIFECRLDNGTWTTCSSPWVLDSLADGAHIVHIRVWELAGNVDLTPAVRTWIVDATPPVVSIVSGPSTIQTDATPTFGFQATGATSTVCRIVRDGFTPELAACHSPFHSAVLADGGHTFEVHARDDAGNQTVATRSFGVDTVAPVITLDGPGLTQDNRPDFTFSASEAVSWRCHFDWHTDAGCASPHQHTTTMSDGDHTFSLTATDAVGRATTVTRAFTIDRFTSVAIQSGPGARTDDTTPRFTFAVGDAVLIRCRIDSAALTPCTSPYIAATLAAGPHEFTVHVTDGAGNTDSESWPFRVDTTPLAITITSGPTSDTPDRTPPFTWTTAGAIARTQCRHDADSFGDCAVAAAVELPDGPHTFEVRIEGDSGAAVAATRSFTVDTVAPSVTFTDGPTGTITTPTASFGFTTAGNPAVTECRLFRESQASGAYVTCGSPHTVDLPPTTTPVPYVFEVRARDQAGNQWSAYRSFRYVSP